MQIISVPVTMWRRGRCPQVREEEKGGGFERSRLYYHGDLLGRQHTCRAGDCPNDPGNEGEESFPQQRRGRRDRVRAT